MNEVVPHEATDESLPAIDVNGLSYSFKNHRALNDVRFQVRQGTLHGFVGLNGAGKTTSLRIICTLLRPQQGRVQVLGRSVTREPKEVRRQIGFMPDHLSMYRQMTVFEYLDFFGAAYGLPVHRRDRVIGDILSLTDMDGEQKGQQCRGALDRVRCGHVTRRVETPRSR